MFTERANEGRANTEASNWFESEGDPGSGFENTSRNTELHHRIIFISLYTNLSISEQSPLWRVFSAHIPVHISWIPKTSYEPFIPKSG